MKDEEIIKLFSSLKKAGVKIIIDFNSGFITNKIYIRELIKNIFAYIGIKSFLYTEPKLTEITSFQGYSRTKNHLRSLYKSSGYTILYETKIKPYYYIPVLINN